MKTLIQITEISDQDAYAKHQNIIIGKTLALDSTPMDKRNGFFGLDAHTTEAITSANRSYAAGEFMSFYQVKYRIV